MKNNKSLSKLTRAELLDLLYRQEKRIESLEEENETLKKQVADKKIRISKVGSIAEASLALSDIFSEAQKAADLYVKNVKHIVERDDPSRYTFPAEMQEHVQRRETVVRPVAEAPTKEVVKEVVKYVIPEPSYKGRHSAKTKDGGDKK